MIIRLSIDRRGARRSTRGYRQSRGDCCNSRTEPPEVAERPGVRVVAFVDFPFRLFYSVNAETIEVLAIRHTSRRPLFE